MLNLNCVKLYKVAAFIVKWPAQISAAGFFTVNSHLIVKVRKHNPNIFTVFFIFELLQIKQAVRTTLTYYYILYQFQEKDDPNASP